ncbi:yqaJ domain-containing protein [Trichonephila clavipes]|nr:yqaJ domain-containing protein [Trichonephila clavipes]
MSEVRKGLTSGIRMKCEMCQFQEMVWTEDPDNEQMPVNTAAVSGVMKIGGGFANLEQLLSTYEEKQLAVQAGEVGPDGFPMLTVAVDGCWAKRSYSHLSTAAAIVGFHTKKVTYMGVGNTHRYCIVCSRAAAENKQADRHYCSKNWHGSSSSTEANIIQEGFMNSVAIDEAHFWLNGYVNKQNCRIWSEANPQVYIETPLHPEKLTVRCALWAGGILLQKR